MSGSNRGVRACTPCFFLTNTPTTQIYTLSLHDALPISPLVFACLQDGQVQKMEEYGEKEIALAPNDVSTLAIMARSEEHTSELQSRFDLVCRLLLEKNKIGRTTCSSRTLSSLAHTATMS